MNFLSNCHFIELLVGKNMTLDKNFKKFIRNKRLISFNSILQVNYTFKLEKMPKYSKHLFRPFELDDRLETRIQGIYAFREVNILRARRILMPRN